jgi:hypothetical protein
VLTHAGVAQRERLAGRSAIDRSPEDVISEDSDMRKPPRTLRPLALASVAFLIAQGAVAQPAGQPEPENAKTWIGRAAEIEDYLRTAKVVKLEQIPVGVTSPRRAYLEPGGPVDSLAFKALPPGRRGGFWESYKSEIAAYEIDKLLGLDMVPPTVEKRVEGELGAASMWATPTKTFKQLGGRGVPTPPPTFLAKFNLALTRAKMFDDLIGNLDPNLGNWLADPSWNVILVDHSRCFGRDTRLYHTLIRVDAGLWEKMQALTEERLETAVGRWVGEDEIRALLERRGRMASEIDELVKKHGAAAVFVK